MSILVLIIDFRKAIINYLAFIKVEVCKISDNQKRIINLIDNMQTNNLQNEYQEHDIDYFSLNWPICDTIGITNMEDKMKSDSSFYKLVVGYYESFLKQLPYLGNYINNILNFGNFYK